LISHLFINFNSRSIYALVSQLISLHDLRLAFFIYLSTLPCTDHLFRDWLSVIIIIIMFCGMGGAIPLFRLNGFMPWTGPSLSPIILLLLSPSWVQKFPTGPCSRVASLYILTFSEGPSVVHKLAQ